MTRQALVQCALEHDSALPQDRVVNTFHFWSADATVIDTATANALADACKEVYQTAHTPGTSALQTKLSSKLGTAATAKVYDLGETAPRVVKNSNQAFSISPATTGKPLPHEIALCLSYKSDLASGDVAARHRGRIYFGPFQDTVLASDGTPDSTIVNILAGIGSYLSNLEPVTGWHWAVRSTAADASYTVTNGWVDNAWDTQRRRGEDPTTRQLWT